MYGPLYEIAVQVRISILNAVQLLLLVLLWLSVITLFRFDEVYIPARMV